MWLVILARIENMKATYSQENSSTTHGGQILRAIYVILVQTAVERVFFSTPVKLNRYVSWLSAF